VGCCHPSVVIKPPLVPQFFFHDNTTHQLQTSPSTSNLFHDTIFSFFHITVFATCLARQDLGSNFTLIINVEKVSFK
jgi:hypothetical protein